MPGSVQNSQELVWSMGWLVFIIPLKPVFILKLKARAQIGLRLVPALALNATYNFDAFLFFLPIKLLKWSVECDCFCVFREKENRNTFFRRKWKYGDSILKSWQDWAWARTANWSLQKTIKNWDALRSTEVAWFAPSSPGFDSSIPPKKFWNFFMLLGFIDGAA